MTIASDSGIQAEAGAPAWRRLALTASLWTLLSLGARNGLRLASNLILTRLLFPEAFGIMAILTACMQGLTLASDLGLGAAVVQSKRGEDPAFLNTAWTVGILRGLGIWLVAALLGWPLAQLYGEPMLLYALPVVGLTAALSGLASTSLAILRRRLKLQKLVFIEIGAYAISLVATISLVWYWRTVWALVLGSLVEPFARTLLSHAFSEGPRNRLYLDSRSARSIVNFGKWIFLSTLMTFLAVRCDRLILGGFLTLDDLGRYSIAIMLSLVTFEVVSLLDGRVLFPIYARLTEEPAPRLRRRIARARLALLGLALPPLWLLVTWGDVLIELLYDPRYAEAGWMLRVLSAGMLLPLATNVGPIPLARGETFVHFQFTLWGAVIMLVCMVVGGAVWGSVGAVVGIAAGHAGRALPNLWIARRYGLWLWHYDLLAVLLSAAVLVTLNFGIRSWV